MQMTEAFVRNLASQKTNHYDNNIFTNHITIFYLFIIVISP